jgi:hypothetical protein
MTSEKHYDTEAVQRWMDQFQSGKRLSSRFASSVSDARDHPPPVSATPPGPTRRSKRSDRIDSPPNPDGFDQVGRTTGEPSGSMQAPGEEETLSDPLETDGSQCSTDRLPEGASLTQSPGTTISGRYGAMEYTVM